MISKTIQKLIQKTQNVNLNLEITLFPLPKAPSKDGKNLNIIFF